AREDSNLELFRVPELGPGLGQHLAHLAVEGVEPLRPVHAHDQDLTIAFCFDDSHAIPSSVNGPHVERTNASLPACSGTCKDWSLSRDVASTSDGRHRA